MSVLLGFVPGLILLTTIVAVLQSHLWQALMLSLPKRVKRENRGSKMLQLYTLLNRTPD